MKVFDAFKSIGRVLAAPFKAVGKLISKGFNKLGKFMNKFGIVGQMGMMFITGGISSAMFQSLSTFGGGFMQGLSVGGNLSQTAHKILSGFARVAKIPGNAIGTTAKETFGTITDAVVGTVGDTYNLLDKALPLPFGGPSKFNNRAEFYDSVSTRITERFGEGVSNISKSTKDAWGNASKFFGQEDFLSLKGYTDETRPDYRTIQVKTGDKIPKLDSAGHPVKNPITGEFEMTDEFKPKTIETKYNVANERLLEEARQRYLASKTPMIDVEAEVAEEPLGFSGDYKDVRHEIAIDPESGEPLRNPITGKPMTRGEQAFEKYSKGNLPTDSLLVRSGSAFMDEMKDYFLRRPVEYLGTAGRSLASQQLQTSMIPTIEAPVSPGYGPQALAQTEKNWAEIMGISTLQPPSTVEKYTVGDVFDNDDILFGPKGQNIVANNIYGPSNTIQAFTRSGGGQAPIITFPTA